MSTSEKDEARRVFVASGGTDAEFEHWWTTAEAYPGGPMVVGLGEARSIAEHRDETGANGT